VLSADLDRRLERPQLVLAAACLVIGVVPVLAVVPAARASAATLGTTDLTRDLRPGLLAVAGLGLALLLGVAGLVFLGSRRRARLGAPRAPTWGCAYPATSSRMQYTASSFASSILRAFGPLAGLREDRTPSAVRVHSSDLVLDHLGRPLWRWVQGASARLRVLQAGRMRWYLVYLLMTLLALLLYLASIPR
jgi:hypothetical protein